jgi:hypothetical protein
MAILHLDRDDDSFRQPYKDFRSYPVNFKGILPYGNSTVLEDYRKRLDEAESSLFNSNDAAIIVPFREYDALGTGLVLHFGVQRAHSPFNCNCSPGH